MTSARRSVGRAALLIVLALSLQSSTCHFHSCTGDACRDEDDEDDGSQTEMLVLPPLRPLGLPLTGPIPLPRQTGDQFR
jgi:hypothetical protein